MVWMSVSVLFYDTLEDHKPKEHSTILQHERKRVLQVSLKRAQPPRAHRAVDRPVVRAQRDLHDLRGREPALVERRRDERRLRRADREDARLRRVDDRREVRDAEHA